MWHHEGQIGSGWEERWHTHSCTQRQGALALVGLACARNANSHGRPLGLEASVGRANTSRLSCGAFRLQTSDVLVTHSESSVSDRETHSDVWHTSTASVWDLFHFYINIWLIWLMWQSLWFSPSGQKPYYPWSCTTLTPNLPLHRVLQGWSISVGQQEVSIALVPSTTSQ